MASRAPRFIQDGTLLDCLDGTSGTHLIYTCSGSWLVEQVSSQLMIFRVQLLDMDQISHSGNQRSMYCLGVERSVRRWFLPAVFLSSCWVPLGRVPKFNEWRVRECKDRKATSSRQVAQSITWQHLHFARIQADYFFTSSSSLLYPQTFSSLLFPLFYFSGTALQLFLSSNSVWKHS